MFSKEVLLDKYTDFVRIFAFADFEAAIVLLKAAILMEI